MDHAGLVIKDKVACFPLVYGLYCYLFKGIIGDKNLLGSDCHFAGIGRTESLTNTTTQAYLFIYFSALICN